MGKIFELLLEGEKAWKSAKLSFQNREENLKLLFKQMDYDKDDLLKESDFRSFLQETGFMASPSEIHALIRRFDRNGDCHIDLEEFLSELGKQQKIKTIEIDFSDELIALFKGIREFFNKIEKARMALLKRYDFNLSDVLELFDSDKTGQISIKEMNKGLNLFGVEFQDKECYLICMRYSTNKSYFLT